MKMPKIEWKTCFKVGLSIFILYLCIHYWPSVSNVISTVFSAATPLLIGAVAAYLINILMSFYERHYFPNSKKESVISSRRPVCLVGAVITLAGIIALVIGLVAPQLVACIKMLIDELPGAINMLIAKLEEWDIGSEKIINTLSAIDWKSRIGEIAKTLTSGLGSVVDVAFTAVTSVFSLLSNGIIGFIFALYLLLSKDKLSQQIKKLEKRYIPEKKAKKIAYVAGVANESFHSFIVGQCTEAVILGTLCMIGMLILQLPYAPMIGALVAFTALIPIVGAFIGAGVGAFLILMESPVKALIFLVFIIILQQVEGNLIYPRVVGSSIGLPGLWVLAAVTLGGGVLGIWGMLIGVPIFAAAYRLIKADVNKEEKTAEPETADNLTTEQSNQ